MNSVNDHMSYTEDINYVIDSKFFKFHKNLYGPYNMAHPYNGCQIDATSWFFDCTRQQRL